MLYRLLRWVAGIALRWFYREVAVAGLDRIPHDAPLLLAANHPNALIDALVASVVVPRRVLLTAKATLAEHGAMRWLFDAVGVVPLRRASDERGRTPDGRVDQHRNTDAFRAIIDALERRQVVLIFPEGISHDAPTLAPLRTGVARMALQARDERRIRGVVILPFGLVFEAKGEPRSRVAAEVGEPIPLDDWPGVSADALTEEVDARLRAVTLNFPSRADADRVRAVSHVLSGVLDDVRPLDAPDPPLERVLAITRRVEEVRRSLDQAPPAARARIDAFVARLDAFQATVARHDVAVNDINLSLDAGSGAWFLVREGTLAAVAGPLAWWGRINHWLPLRLARWLARRSSESPEDPAMHTIVVGLALVLLFYALQTGLVTWLAGPWWALAYLISLPPSAGWDFRYQDRRRRAMQRMRTFLLLRRDPALRDALRAESAWLREEAAVIDRGEVSAAPAPWPARR